MKYRKCIDQFLKEESLLQEITTRNERTLTFNPDSTVQQTLSSLSGLGQILRTVKQSQSSKGTSQNTLNTQNKPKVSRQSDPGNKTSPKFNVKQSTPDSNSSTQNTLRNQWCD
ncbi:hypothetical protein DPMN_098234 [Dreissena polymorpha]|uniref:Uncharacterized protein n=1 Tax=Dreissena polymorpha TaxID=45954 RepID=A0A9D4LD79_DREPO|nr:hypothetical protein DPMN_098234 [Dreissena polymorpha]